MRPHELLPIDFPKDYDPGVDWFYNNIAKHLSKDFIKLMNAGLTINQEAVDNLRGVLDDVLKTVEDTLAKDQIIQEFQKAKYPKKFTEYEKEVTASCRVASDYYKEYNPDTIVHRTWLVNFWLAKHKLWEMQRDKWTVNDLKKYADYSGEDFISWVINKEVDKFKEDAEAAMWELAHEKAAIWNKVRFDKVQAVQFEDLIPPFNPGSSKQLRELFEWLNVEPLAFSDKTGEPSWGRDQIEEVKQTAPEEWHSFLQAFIDYSFSSIVRTNFIEGFDKFVIEDTLHGNFKNFGAKTFRPTSNSINLLNMPSTGSIYAKPLKKCIVAPPGYLVWSIDYSALEDRVMACLSGDKNKASIFTEGLDGHSLNACGYFPERIAKIIGEKCEISNSEYVKMFMAELDSGNKELKAIRQESKGPTFGLAYGAYPKKIAATIKCSIEQAEEIFNNYHNVLYAGITDYRENYVLPTAKAQGYIHLGLGCRIYSSDPDKDIRTLNNATVQFWSILTLIALNELHYRIDKDGRQNDIIPNATIYDALYGIVRADVDSISWLNRTIVPIMEKDFLKEQVVHNEVELELGLNWSDLAPVPKEASTQDIRDMLINLVEE